MKKLLLLLAVALIPTMAYAQSQAPQVTPSEYAVQIQQLVGQVSQGVGQFAQLAENQRRQIEALQKQVADLTAQLNAKSKVESVPIPTPTPKKKD